ncbi:MAG: tRNA 2-thiouridine(34) synthase MnmA [bacterium]|nr:tRNA 2-thiouridine(34) synthase MnmA [bacterium]
MSFPLPLPEPLRRALPPGTGVLLGLSGGVDSAVALAVLKELGCRVECVTFRNFCYAEGQDTAGEQACCSLDAIDQARRLAVDAGAPHWVGDLVEPFRARVIDPFIAEYAQGRTPNPCLSCNESVRFPELVRLAARQGCVFAATGHYARIDRDGATPRLRRGLDPAKDQSYFLHRLDTALLGSLVFPLGWYAKDDVRAAARALALPVAERRDSQEICFVPDDDRSFLFADAGTAGAQAVAAATTPGPIVDRGGRRLGTHRGLAHYTVGQRKGLGIAAPAPLYVLALQTDGNRLVVGPREGLLATRLVADRFVAQVPDLPERWPGPRDGPWATVKPLVQVRHRHAGTAVAAWRWDGDRLEVELAEPVAGAAPGQGLAIYDRDLVLGGGRLLAADGAGTGGA